jgi:thioredoxin 1
MLTITDDNFDEIINSNKLILVDFWAEWCGPCKRMLPILEEVDLEGLVLIGKIDADENLKKAKEFSVVSIPTMILFKDGQPVHTIIGAIPKHRLVKEISEWI